LITTIGRRPIATGKGLMLLVHHTDADREWAYDRESNIGTTKWGRLIRLDFFCFQNTKSGHILAVMVLTNCNFYKQKIVKVLSYNHKNRCHK
jgi:hypothetical protein